MRTVENSLTSDTKQNTAQQFLERMQLFYELFPYPNRPLFLRPNPEGSVEAHAGYSRLIADKPAALTADALEDLKLRDVRHAFPNSKPIALVGCGTDEPLLFRTLHPHNPIVGFDLSLKALTRAQRKIQWHQLKPVRLVHGDACLGLREEGLFAHIQCFGVLHHQPEPQAMLIAMADALELNGTLRLMIYSRTGRRLERGVQRKFQKHWERVVPGTEETAEAKTPASAGLSARFKLCWISCQLLTWRILLPLFAPRTLARRFRYIGFSRARVADAFLHPSDHPTCLKNTLVWAQDAGLELVSYEAKSYDLGRMSSHASKKTPIETLVSEEERGNISSNIVLVFKKVGAGSWTSR